MDDLRQEINDYNQSVFEFSFECRREICPGCEKNADFAWHDATSREFWIREHDLICVNDSLLRGRSVHGASRELYLDNAKVYHADPLKAACYSLNIRLLHRPPRDPPPGGLIERFFRTCPSQFDVEVRYDPYAPLEQVELYSLDGVYLGPGLACSTCSAARHTATCGTALPSATICTR